MAKNKRTRKPKSANDNAELVSEFAAQHGDYRPSTVVDLTGELGGKRQSMVTVMRNRATTLVDRWLIEGGPGFEEPQARAIQWTQGLWEKAGRAGPVMSSWGEARTGGAGDGQGQQDALTELARIKARVPAIYWNVYEDVCRHDMLAGDAGRAITTGRRSAHENARACVGFVASLIAMWRGYSVADFAEQC